MEEKYIIEPGNKFFEEVVLDFFKKGFIGLWDMFIKVLPDLVGLGAMVVGGFIIIGVMIGRGGMMKPMAYLSGGTVLALCLIMIDRGA